MGVYADRILPRIVDRACGGEDLTERRRRAAAGLHGTIVVPGFASGHDLPVLPAEVTKVHAIDPAVIGRELAADRLAASPVEVEFTGLDGQSIPLPDDSCDGGLLTFTLCTIPEPDLALAELRRVIRPGGTLHVLEHGRAPDPGVRRAQRWFEPVQRRVAGGCHLTRDIPALVESAGFEIEEQSAEYAPGPKPWTWFTTLRARNP